MDGVSCCQTTGWNSVTSLLSNLCPLLIHRTQKTVKPLPTDSVIYEMIILKIPFLEYNRNEKTDNIQFLNIVINNKIQVHDKACNNVMGYSTKHKFKWQRVCVLSSINQSVTLKHSIILSQLLLTNPLIQRLRQLEWDYHSSSKKWRLNKFLK